MTLADEILRMNKEELEEKFNSLDESTLRDIFQEFQVPYRKTRFDSLIREILTTQQFMRISGTL